MKISKILFPSLFIMLTIFSGCSNDDTDQGNSKEFPMTAKINGILYEMTNPFGTNEDTARIFGYNYSNQDYIILQGRPDLNINALSKEINIFINRDDLKVGTYNVGVDTDEVTTHIDLIDLETIETENTISGNITITSIDTTNKIVKGTFEFDAADESNINSPINSVVTEGTFNYKYDVR